MKYYTSGELAKACGVSTRTIQYYDIENILKSNRVENSHRMYSENGKMLLDCICFYKSMSCTLDEIREILSEKNGKTCNQEILITHELSLKSEINELIDKQITLQDMIQYIEKHDEITAYDINTLLSIQPREMPSNVNEVQAYIYRFAANFSIPKFIMWMNYTIIILIVVSFLFSMLDTFVIRIPFIKRDY